MKAALRQVRVTSKKASLIAKLVRNKNALEALDILKFTRKKAAPILRKVLESAMANAVNNTKQIRENLFIKEIVITEGPTYKRGIPISRGRTHPILKRTSHINIRLEVKAPVAPKVRQVKSRKEDSSTKPEVVPTK